jgi:hypothetical protein
MCLQISEKQNKSFELKGETEFGGTSFIKIQLPIYIYFKLLFIERSQYLEFLNTLSKNIYIYSISLLKKF